MKTINEIQNQINTGAGFVTVRDLCKYFNCHKGSIYDAIRKGYLRYINIGKGTKRPSYRIAADSVKVFRNKLLQGRAAL